MECFICYDIFKDPRFLDCGHSFCFECIKKFIAAESFVCPVCRESISVAYEWRPKKNYQLSSMIKEFKKMQKENLKELKQKQSEHVPLIPLSSSPSASESSSLNNSAILVPLLEEYHHVDNTVFDDEVRFIAVYIVFVIPLFILAIYSLVVSEGDCSYLREWLISWNFLSIFALVLMIINIEKNWTKFDALNKFQLLLRVALIVDLFTTFLLIILGIFLLCTTNTCDEKSSYIWYIALSICIFYSMIFSLFLLYMFFKYLISIQFFRGFSFEFDIPRHISFICLHIFAVDLIVRTTQDLLAVIMFMTEGECQGEFKNWLVQWICASFISLPLTIAAIGASGKSGVTYLIYILTIANYFLLAYLGLKEKNSCYYENYSIWLVNLVISSIWLIFMIISYFVFNFWLLAVHRRVRRSNLI